MKFLPKLFQASDSEQSRRIEGELLHMEAKIGGELFGPLPKGRSRQFFCLDEQTWIWHESWKDESGQRRTVTTRYHVRPGGILKSQDGHTYQPVSGQEARNLRQTALLYQRRVGSEYQRLLQTA